MSGHVSAADIGRKAVVICIDVPTGHRIGLDGLVHTVGPKFKGYKLVPSGVHLLTSSSGDDKLVCSVWLDCAPGRCDVFRWNSSEESLVRAEENEAKRYAAAAFGLELDAHLAPYDAVRSSPWMSLTSHITAAVVERIKPVGDFVFSGTELGSLAAEGDGVARSSPTSSTGTETVGGRTGGTSHSSGNTAEVRGTFLYFTPVPGHGAGSRAVDRTAYAIDTSFALLAQLGQLLRHTPQAQLAMKDGGVQQGAARNSGLALQLVGQMQASFALFLFGQAYSGLEAWKRQVDVLCRCEDVLLYATSAGGTKGLHRAIQQAVDNLAYKKSAEVRQQYSEAVLRAVPLLDAAFFNAAYSALSAQLQTLPADLFEPGSDLAPTSHFLRPALTSVVSTLRSVGRAGAQPCSGPAADEGVRRAVQSLASRWRARFGQGQDIPGSDALSVLSTGRASGIPLLDSAAGAEGNAICTDRAALLAALAEECGEDDLPMVVDETE